MVFHEDDVGVSNGGRDMVALSLVESKSVVFFVYDLCRPKNFKAVWPAKMSGSPSIIVNAVACGICVEGHPSTRNVPVETCVNAKGRGLGLPLACNDIAVEITDQQAGGGYPAECVSIRIYNSSSWPGQDGRESDCMKTTA